MSREKPRFTDLITLLESRGAEAPEAPAYTFLEDGEAVGASLTYGELAAAARRVAARLQQDLSPGDRALLLYPPGLDFVVAYLGCLYAGVVAVPAYPPRSRRTLPRLLAIVQDARPAAALTLTDLEPKIAAVSRALPAGRELPVLTTDGLDPALESAWRRPKVDASTLAFLQYTSGSTSTPKGVQVSHGNLLVNEELIRQAFVQTSESVIVGWLPLYHDMGLIGNVLQPLYLGASCVLMAPVAFLQRPARWLEAIQRYGGTTSGGPNFAYELCCDRIPEDQREGLDLSTWTLAFNGAEPVRAATLERFAREFAPYGFDARAFYPCYGLAEATLFVSGGEAGSAVPTHRFGAAALEKGRAEVVEAAEPGHDLVGCGRAWGDHRVEVVDPETFEICAEGQVGEIWVEGASVAGGYFQNPEKTAEDFGRSLASGEGSFLRTGDLGFVSDGELFVTGRIKDLIILRGRNLYPQDLELTAERAHASLRPGCGAAFAVEAEAEERLVVVQEVDRRRESEAVAAAEAVRRAVAEEHEAQAHEVVIVRAGTVPKTSSGKIQRHAARRLYLAGELHAVGRAEAVAARGLAAEPAASLSRSDLGALPPAARGPRLASYLASRLAGALGVPPGSIPRATPLTALGLDSLGAVELGHAVATDLETELPLERLLDGPTLEEVTADLLAALGEGATPPALLPIRRVDPRSRQPLSAGQKALWLLYRLRPESPAYLIVGAGRVLSALDAEALPRAVELLADRHGVLRTLFDETEEGVYQRLADVSPSIEIEDAEGWEPEHLEEAMAAAAYRPFDLSREAPMRVALWRVGPEHYRLTLTVHHLVADLASLEILLHDLSLLYRPALFARGELPPDLPPLSMSYGDYVAWQEERLAGEVGESLRSYWRQALARRPDALELPTDRPRPHEAALRGEALPFTFDAGTREAVEALARRLRTTPFAILASALSVVLARYAGQPEMLLGTPTVGRPRPELSGLVGYFVNPVVLRADLRGEPSFADAVARFHAGSLGAFAHRELPFPLLVQELAMERQSAQSALFQVMVAYQKAVAGSAGGAENLGAFALGVEGGRVGLGELTIRSARFAHRGAQLDLACFLAATPAGLQGSLQYDSDLFDGSTIGRLAGHLRNALNSLLENPEAPVSRCELVRDEERRQLLGPWASGGAEAPERAPLQQPVWDRARERPERIALVAGDEHWSYGALVARAESVARRLRELAVRPEERVGVCLERGPDLVASILGVLAAGAAYVPLDPAYPEERLAFTLEDSAARILLSRERLAQGLGEGRLLIDPASLDSGPEPAVGASLEVPPTEVAQLQLAYLIYTSGSTGRPKGVAISHDSAAQMVRWSESLFRDAEIQRVLAATSVCFDLSVYEIFVPLSRGGTVVLVDNALSLLEPDLGARLTLINTVPSAMAVLCREGALPASVRTVNLAGEPLKRRLVDEVYAAASVETVWNLYGPSEDTTYSTFALAPRGSAAEPTIGRPISGSEAYVTDGVGQLSPLGVPGELRLGGVGLARGYLGRPARTAASFVPDPFGTAPGARLYRTGDRVRWRPDGELEFLGRLDHQVKLRGFRIEMGEVESALLAADGVGSAVAMVREDVPGSPELVAYVVAEAAAPADEEAWLGEIRQRLANTLPGQAVPTTWVALQAMPLLPNGKIDRRELPAPERRGSGGEGETGERNAQQVAIAEIFSEVLKVEKVGLHDNFFDLGGHSLLATQVVGRIHRRLGVRLPLSALFSAQSVATLASAVETHRGQGGAAEEEETLVLDPNAVNHPLAPSQERLWFLDRLDPGQATYNMPAVVDLQGDLLVEHLAGSLWDLARRHEILRTVFPTVGDVPTQQVLSRPQTGLGVVDLTGLTEAERGRQIQDLSRTEARRPFDLSRGPLLRSRLLRLDDTHHRLLLTLHHIVSDGWSMGVLLREVVVLYDARRRGSEAVLPDLALQYGHYARWQREWLSGPETQVALDYWRSRLAGAPPLLALPTDRIRPAVQSFRGATVNRPLDAALMQRFEAVCRERGATLFAGLWTLFQELLRRYTRSRDLVVGTAVANRDRPELEELIGFFVNMLPLRSELEGDPGFGDWVEGSQRLLLQDFAHQRLPFERLVEELAKQRDPSYSPLFQVALVLQNTPFEEGDLGGLRVEPRGLTTETSKFDLSLVMEQNRGFFEGLWEYNADLFDASSVARMAGHLEGLLRAAVEDPATPLSAISLLSEQERRQLVAWSSQPGGADEPILVDAAVAAWADRAPRAPAVVAGQSVVTYGELLSQARRLARALRARRVTAETPVAVLLPRSAELVYAQLAVLQAGGAYVCLDPAYPDERLATMLEDSGAELLIADRRTADRLPETAHSVLLLDRDSAWRELPDPPLAQRSNRQGWAYAVYTSGSTGRPKGVAIPHGGLAALAAWHRRACDLGPEDRCTLLAAPGFDASVWEIWGTLAAGAALHVVPDEVRISPRDLASWLREQGITVSFLPTPLLESLLQADPPLGEPDFPGGTSPLRLVLTGGDRLRQSPPLGLSWRLINNYGPAECSVVASAGEVTAGGDRLPTLGRPLPHAQLHVVDERGALQPVGVPGEIWIGGAGLARGYLGSPAATAQRFLPDPFSGGAGSRLYRSGDLARWRAEGELEFLGRTDSQVQVRGFRIELGEIEAVLESLPGVTAAAALVRDDLPGEARLVGYLVGEGGDELTASARRHLAERLPDYMVPSDLVRLDAMPLTANDKIDRRALPAPQRSTEQTSGPASALEESLAEIWRQLLGVTKVGRDESFFDLGGHSLLLAQAQTRIREELGIEVPIVDLLRYPTLASLARHLGADEAAAQPVEPWIQPREHRDEPVAIIGMAGRFPGADDVDTLWRNLLDGVEAFRQLSDEDLAAAGVPAERIADPAYVRRQPVLDDVEAFDAAFFGYSPRDAEIMDPQQRIFLETAWQALEHAGWSRRWSGGQVGVFAGLGANTYAVRHIFNNPRLLESVGAAQAILGIDKDFLTTRIAYNLDLRGPAITVQTACSTSLVAVHLACESLRRGECTTALAGGVTVRVPQGAGYAYVEGGIESPDGTCRPFDAEARGTVVGSGAGAVVLKRLSAARRDGDRIYAVVRGSAMNNDGSDKLGFTAPSVEGQKAVITAALAQGGIEPESVGFVETHGTGTPLGDPIEITALREALDAGVARDEARETTLGAVKANVGHLDTAAGVTGLIKAALVVHHGRIPPHPSFATPNPKLGLEDSRLRINTEVEEWIPEGGPRRAGVSSFGIGGTNVHVVLEQAPTGDDDGCRALADEAGPELMVVSGHSRAALEAAALRMAARLDESVGERLSDLAHTSRVGRRAHGHRLAVTGRTTSAIAEELRRAVAEGAGEPPSSEAAAPVFVCPDEPLFEPKCLAPEVAGDRHLREALEGCAAALGRVADETDFDLLGAFADFSEADGKLEEEDATVAGVAWQIALAERWRAYGLSPAALIPVGIGRWSALALAGVLGPGEALHLSRLWARHRKSGSTAAAQRLSGTWRNAIRRAPRVPMISPRTARWLAEAEALEVETWIASPARPPALQQALETASDLGSLGVRLGGPAAGACSEPSRDPVRPACGSMAGSQQNPRRAFLDTLGYLWQRGAEPDWRVLDEGRHLHKVALPTYPFQRQHFTLADPSPPEAPTAAPTAGQWLEEDRSFVQGGRYLILGGLGHEAFAFALALALHRKAHLVLTAPLDGIEGEEAEGRRRLLLRAGATAVEIVPGLAAASETLEHALERSRSAFGGLDALVHGLATVPGEPSRRADPLAWTRWLDPLARSLEACGQRNHSIPRVFLLHRGTNAEDETSALGGWLEEVALAARRQGQQGWLTVALDSSTEASRAGIGEVVSRLPVDREETSTGRVVDDQTVLAAMRTEQRTNSKEWPESPPSPED